MIEIPIGLKQAIESGDCILFIGAGIGANVLDKNGTNAPNAKELAAELNEYFKLNYECNDLSKISQVLDIKNKRIELQTFIKNKFANMMPDDLFKWIPTINWKAIYTTNYDNFIEKAYDINAKPQKEYYVITHNSNLLEYDSRFQVPIYHLHGSLFADESPSIVITEKDYTKYQEKRRMMFEQLKMDAASSTILYIGYSNNDSNWKQLITDISTEFYPQSLPQSYRIDPFTSDIDVEILRNDNIDTLKCTFSEFVNSCMLQLDEQSTELLKIENLQKYIPSEFKEIFTKNPAAVSRLFTSWEYVNGANFSDKPNIYEFLRGDKPNWSLIGADAYFTRDIEEDVYDSILDYLTSFSKKPKATVILGSAGYGVTTLMMILAKRAVADKACKVFFYKNGHDFREGDFEFVNSVIEEKTIFFIDNAADNISQIDTLFKKYNDENKSCMFILGERKNEWMQANSKIRANFHEVLPLSDGEINRLIQLLEDNNELNHLDNLSKEMQFSAIKRNYKSELLVAIREATEGKSFDAIIEDEFRGINSDISQKAYLTVCCFSQHDAYIRVDLLAAILGIDLITLYDKTKNNTAGIINYECIDEINGYYVARARHRLIAQIVWEHCGDIGTKRNLTISALNNLNLLCTTDKKAFEKFIRSDRLIDGLNTLDDKMKFFDRACNKDPDNPYVKQHYARMLLRAGNENLALSQIDEAIKIEKCRVFYHTKGIILSKMMESSSIDIARKRLFQSEECFNIALSMYPKDEYSYQGLAELYLSWAKIINDEEESIEYIAKAESVINSGLKVVKQKESLFIESSRIEDFCNEQEERIEQLKRALSVNPNSIIVRYLLARAYNQNNKYQEALDVLKPGMEIDPNEFRLFIEYAMALLHLGHSYDEAISVLKQSTLYGLSDPKFISVLGGLLFLNKNFKEAKEIFNESIKREMSGVDLLKIHFKPFFVNGTKKEELRLNGVVKIVKSGYSLINTASYPEFMCPGSKYNGILMTPGLNVTFVPAFTPKGVIAIKIQNCSNEEIVEYVAGINSIN